MNAAEIQRELDIATLDVDQAQRNVTELQKRLEVAIADERVDPLELGKVKWVPLFPNERWAFVPAARGQSESDIIWRLKEMVRRHDGEMQVWEGIMLETRPIGLLLKVPDLGVLKAFEQYFGLTLVDPKRATEEAKLYMERSAMWSNFEQS